MDNNKPNTFVRALTFGLVLALCSMSFFNFFWRDPPFEISAGLLALLALIVLLSLSEIFDKLQFGTILSLQRKVSEAKESNGLLREDNRELRAQVMTLVSNIQQSQVNNTFNAPPEAWAKLLGVVPAKEPSDKESVESQLPEPTGSRMELAANQSEIVGQSEPSEARRQSTRDKFERYRVAEAIAIRKYFDSIPIPQSERMINVEFSSSFQGIDPVMDRRIVFDGYVKVDGRERFIEAVRAQSPSMMFADRIYVMLTKIWLYRQAKKIQAELVLMLVDIEDVESDGRRFNSNRLLEYFQPAIANDLLRVESVTILAAEIDLELSNGQKTLL